MAVYVNTNYSALQGQRYLGNVQNQLTTTYQRLSSGMRINSAKDDAAGLQIADRLTSQISGLNQGNRNASDGIALAQTMEAGMDEVSGMLQKIRTLAVQANNGTNTAEDRTAISKEMSSLATEVNRIAMQTTYAGKTILNGHTQNGSIFGDKAAGGPPGPAGGGIHGAEGTMTLQVGSNKGDTISFKMNSIVFSQVAGAGALIGNTNATVFKTANDGTVTVDLNKAEAAGGKSIGDVINLMDTMISKVDGMRADLGAIQNHISALKKIESFNSNALLAA